jgi:hypothetical protein
MNNTHFNSPEEQILFIREMLADWARGEMSDASTCFAIHSILTEVEVTDEDVRLAEKVIKDYQEKRSGVGREGEENLNKIIKGHKERREEKEHKDPIDDNPWICP